METVFWFGGSFGFFCLENGGSSILRNIVVYTKVHVGISRKTTVCDILSFYGLQIFQAPECLHMVSALVVYTSQSAFYWIPLMSLYVVLLCCLQLKWPVSRSPYLTSDHSDMVHRPLIRNLNEISGLPNKKKKTGKLVSYNILSVRWKSHTIVFCVFQEALKNMSLLNKTIFFYDRMTVHRDRFLVNETNRRTEFQFYWYYDSTCFGQPFCPSSGVLSLQRHWYILCSCDEPFDTRSRMELPWQFRPTIHHNCIKCTNADVG